MRCRIILQLVAYDAVRDPSELHHYHFNKGVGTLTPVSAPSSLWEDVNAFPGWRS